MTRPTRAVIDLEALSHNATLLRKLAGSRRLMAVVKADAYGHGLVDCARTLSPRVDAFAVAFLDEAVVLRQAGLGDRILVLEGPMDVAEADSFAELGLWPVVHRAEQLSWFEQSPTGTPEGLWLKVDTGLHRLGLEIDTLSELVSRAESMAPVTLMSHLACAGDVDDPLSQTQMRRWQAATERFDLPTSLLNSASSLLADNDESQWLRPGYLFYGGQPDGLGSDLGFRPVMRLTSAVIAVRSIAAGERVGYGGRWLAQRDSRIATLPIGYADGYPRAARDGTPVLVGGHKVPLAGRVSMDMMTVDVTEHPDIQVGAPAQLWGDTPGVDEVATHAGTIGYELTSQVTARVPRWLNTGSEPGGLPHG